MPTSPTTLTIGLAPGTRDAGSTRGTAEQRLLAAGGARPVVWVGGEAPGGLGLPSALATRSQMYAPRGVWLDDEHFVVADTGNHRVLIWHGAPTEDYSDADIVIGQVDFEHEGAQSGGRGPANGLRLPTGVLVHEGRLVVADAWNHRVLIWNTVPQRNDVAPDVVIGQADGTSVDENRGGNCGPLGFYWPFGVSIVGNHFYIADTGNRRVLGWPGLPEPDQPPSIVIGQPSPFERDENRGELGPCSFRWPHDIAGTDDALFIADAGNHRVLGWVPPPSTDREADLVLGQTDFLTGTEFPYKPQTTTSMRFPYAIDISDGVMAVADTANNRILVWDAVPQGSTVPADKVFGQPDFAKNGENRWDAVVHDSLCWPYGLSLHGNRMAIADSGNNRAMIWELGT